ncbi:MAG: hypothetical protein Q8R39_01700 [bacterium]|nr:hypothetical protein [bacterium]MDZ4285172.1 hypothetical protein [Patescibacteria group bacterium]
MSLNPQAKLVPNPFDIASLEKKPTRDGFGKGLVEAGEIEIHDKIRLCIR